jgi:hypothetical protein
MSIPLSTSLPIVAAATVVLTFAGKAIQYIYRAVRRNETTQEFTVQMACNHLPHIYHVLELLCHKLDVEVTEPPPIRFTDYKDGK